MNTPSRCLELQMASAGRRIGLRLWQQRVQTAQVRKRLVDATITHTSIPLTHTRKFTVADGLTCVPPNDLTRLAPGWKHFTVLGAGKTAIDGVLWLLANGAPPENITWVLPRDPWMLNRAAMQPGSAHFEPAIGGMACQFEIFATAGSVRDLCLQMESTGRWMRLDSNVWPTMFHGATVTPLELEKLRGIDNIVRSGALAHDQARPADLQRHPDRAHRGHAGRRRRQAPAVPAHPYDRHGRRLSARDGGHHAQSGGLECPAGAARLAARHWAGGGEPAALDVWAGGRWWGGHRRRHSLGMDLKALLPMGPPANGLHARLSTR